jgi:hypothetical protein
MRPGEAQEACRLIRWPMGWADLFALLLACRGRLGRV